MTDSNQRKWIDLLVVAALFVVSNGIGATLSLAQTASNQEKAGVKSYTIEKTPFDYLINEPASLLDVGLMKMRIDLKAAARRLYDGGLASREPLSGAYYDWRSQGLTLYVSVRETLSQPSTSQCLETFGHVRRSVLGTHPKGPNQASYYLESIFGHAFSPRWGRPPGMVEQILDTTSLEIVILPPNPMQGGKKVACSGALNANIEDIVTESTS